MANSLYKLRTPPVDSQQKSRPVSLTLDLKELDLAKNQGAGRGLWPRRDGRPRPHLDFNLIRTQAEDPEDTHPEP